MPNRNYERGRAFEYRVKAWLEKQGYFVMRSAGSHTPVDLIAIKGHENKMFGEVVSKTTEIRLIQCKAFWIWQTTKPRKLKNDRESKELGELADQLGVSAWLAYKDHLHRIQVFGVKP